MKKYIFSVKQLIGSNGYANGKVSDGKKEIYVYPLKKGFSDRLCKENKRLLGHSHHPEGARDWAEEEFGGVEVYDERLKERLYTLAGYFYSQPGELVPQACSGSNAKVKAAYRFFDNGNINMEVLLKPHIETSIDHIANAKLIYESYIGFTTPVPNWYS